jgi:hypothetical protein
MFSYVEKPANQFAWLSAPGATMAGSTDPSSSKPAATSTPNLGKSGGGQSSKNNSGQKTQAPAQAEKTPPGKNKGNDHWSSTKNGRGDQGPKNRSNDGGQGSKKRSLSPAHPTPAKRNASGGGGGGYAQRNKIQTNVVAARVWDAPPGGRSTQPQSRPLPVVEGMNEPNPFLPKPFYEASNAVSGAGRFDPGSQREEQRARMPEEEWPPASAGHSFGFQTQKKTIK